MLPAGLVIAAGAAAYALALGPGGVTFDVTPLFLGAVALAAAVLGGRLVLVSTALGLMGWGAAVMLVRHGPLPDAREAPAFLVGAAVGLAVAALLARARPGLRLGDGSLALVVGGLGFYFAFDEPDLYDWPVWTAVLVVWAAWELVRPRLGARPGTGATSLPRS